MENKLFFYDPLNHVEYTYSGFFYSLNTSSSFRKVVRSADYFEIFQNIVLSLIHDVPVTLIDYDLTVNEIYSLGMEQERIDEVISIDNVKTVNMDNFIDLINSNRNWNITLFTSGTTGTPKKISHSFSTLTRAVRINTNKHADIWGFAYNPTHIAGLQVFFQALLNRNSIVRLFGLSRSFIYSLVENYSISSISATPTFYRMLLPFEKEYHSVKRITSGGEKFDNNLSDTIKHIFPDAKLLNIYASTEAGTIFVSVNDFFVLKEEFKNNVKIFESELFLHKDLLGTSEAFSLAGEWYRTGDLVEIIQDNPLIFKFVSRKNEIINVGGYKVNPLEVEMSLNSHPGVELCRVYAKKNSVMGNIVMAEVKKREPELEEKALRLFLTERLQAFKIPRIINFVDSIDTTLTGKLKRQ